MFLIFSDLTDETFDKQSSRLCEDYNSAHKRKSISLVLLLTFKKIKSDNNITVSVHKV